MTVPTPKEHSLQLELSKLKHQKRLGELDEPEAAFDTPAWMNDVTQESDTDPRVHGLMGNLTPLLQQLPIVAQATDLTIKDDYYKQIVAEFGILYCALVNIIENDTRLSDVQKQQEVDKLIEERNTRLLDVATLMGSYEIETPTDD